MSAVPEAAPRDNGWQEDDRPLPGMAQIMALARAAMPEISAQPVDGIARAERSQAGWQVVVEVIESAARLGDNDLLSAYELELDLKGRLTGFRRLRRYHREDSEA